MTEQIWQCPKCGLTLSEYHNGCVSEVHREPVSLELVMEVA